MIMTINGLRKLTGSLNGEAAVTVSIQGVLYDLHASVGCEMHDADSPYIVLTPLDGGHRYGRSGDRRG